MRLLNVRTFTFSEFEAPNIPPYAVASHRWTAEEASIRDFLLPVPAQRKSRWPFSKKAEPKPETPGVRKVKGFCRFISNNFDNIDWLWIDTCCINQESSSELHESINSMFQWYQNAAVCLAYLTDVEDPIDMESFMRSVWFSRGWTLQELLAPATVCFLTRGWIVIGITGCDDTTLLDHLTKTYQLPSRHSLDQTVSGITGIPVAVVQDYKNSRTISIEDKFAWMRHRRTKKPEDMAYALLGLFGVFLPLIYGEGEVRATRRLRDAIAQDAQSVRSEDFVSKVASQLDSYRAANSPIRRREVVAEPSHSPSTNPPVWRREVVAEQSHPPITSLHSHILPGTEDDDQTFERRMGTGSSTTDAPKYTILGLRRTLEMLSIREKHLQNRIDEQDAIARKYVANNKSVAKAALRRKKQYEHQLEETTSQTLTVEREIGNMEFANIKLER